MFCTHKNRRLLLFAKCLFYIHISWTTVRLSTIPTLFKYYWPRVVYRVPEMDGRIRDHRKSPLGIINWNSIYFCFIFLFCKIMLFYIHVLGLVGGRERFTRTINAQRSIWWFFFFFLISDWLCIKTIRTNNK